MAVQMCMITGPPKAQGLAQLDIIYLTNIYNLLCPPAFVTETLHHSYLRLDLQAQLSLDQ